LRSKSKGRVVVNTTPELYERFYAVRAEARRHYRIWSMTNRRFLQLLLDALEEKMTEEKMKRALKAY
jgi:hypothetical protein